MMRASVGMLISLFTVVPMAAELTVDVNAMPRIVFTGDSQTVGCVGAMDYAQMIAREVPLRVFNRSVGGSNTTHLLYEFGGGTVTVKAGETVVHGENVSWTAGPYIGQRVRLGAHEYTVDSIEPVDYAARLANLHLTEPAREDYSGSDYSFEPGWRVRIAEVQPRYACFMFTVNDAGWESEEFKARLAEISRRCRDAGIQPIFLSGVPFMDARSGGSHAGTVEHTGRRAQDLLEFCEQKRLPYGDVYRTLDWLDPQRTSVWADTIHPTNDGSIVVVHALRYLLRELGATDNPYYVHGYRAPDAHLPEPGHPELTPITTAQPRRDQDNRLDQAGHNLEAQRVRDEYGLIAATDGQVLRSETPLVFQVGVGSAEKLESFEVKVTVEGPDEVLVYNWSAGAWAPITEGPNAATRDHVRGGALWICVVGAAPAVDYLAVILRGDVAPWEPPQSDRAIVWPTPGQFEWTQAGNLFPNGALIEADGDRPAGWQVQGERAVFLPAGVVATGAGEFVGARGEQFTCAGAQFTQTVRPLDMLVVEAEIKDGGNFLVERVIDDETLELRRWPPELPGATAFTVQRTCGLRAAPDGGCLEVTEGSRWQTRVALEPGEYRLGFFYRAFDPARMSATARPAVRPMVVVGGAGTLRSAAPGTPPDDVSFVWLRGWREVTVPAAGDVVVDLSAEGAGAVQYTGFSLQQR